MSCSGLRTIRRYSSRRRKDSRWRAQPGHRRSTSRGIRSASPSVKWSDVHSLSTNTRGEGFRRHDLVAVLVQLLHLEVLSFDDPGSSAVGRAFRPCRARSTWMAVPICCARRNACGRAAGVPPPRPRRSRTSSRHEHAVRVGIHDRPLLPWGSYEYRIFIEGAEDSSVSNFSSEKLWDGASFRANKPGHDVNGRMLVIYRSRLPRQRAGGTGAVACRQAALEPGAYRRRQSRPCRRLRLAWRGCEGDRHRARRANRPPDHRSRDHARNPQDHPGLLANGDDDRAVRADEH
jgi:hypothetical protein